MVFVVFSHLSGTGAALAWAAGKAAPSKATMAVAIRRPLTDLLFMELILCVIDIEDKRSFEMLADFTKFIAHR
jgi:hypothetical protein